MISPLRPGFTFLELILVIAIVSSIATLGFALGSNRIGQRAVQSQQKLTANLLKQAQQYSVNRKNNTNWGVLIDNTNDQLVLYSGTSYAARTASLDVPVAYTGNVTISGASEVNFSRLTGATSPVTITITLGADSEQVSVNSLGVVSP